MRGSGSSAADGFIHGSRSERGDGAGLVILEERSETGNLYPMGGGRPMPQTMGEKEGERGESMR